MTTGHEIALGLRAAYLTMHRRTQTLLSEFGVTPFQYVVLSVLCAEDGVTQRELTERASSDASTISATLLLLERDGILVRESHEKDGRAWKVTVTSKGRKVYLKLSDSLRPLQELLLSAVGLGEAESFVANLNSVASEMSR